MCLDLAMDRIRSSIGMSRQGMSIASPYKPVMLPSDLTFRRGGNDLFFKVNGTTDQLRVVDWFTTDGKVERVEFADGTVLAPADINALILQATDTDDEIIGTDENDVIAGGGGNDFIDGALGDDSLYGDNGFDGHSRRRWK